MSCYLDGEYAKYLKYNKNFFQETSNQPLAQEEYKKQLEVVRQIVGNFINDPRDSRSDIGRKIFDYLDINTALKFIRVSKSCYARSMNHWFSFSAQTIIQRYIQHGADFKDFLTEEGWKDIIISALKASGIAVTIFAGVRSAQHARRVPKGAPKKTKTVIDTEGAEHQVTYVDHPEAAKAATWSIVAASTGVVTTVGILSHAYRKILAEIDIDLFLSATERELIGPLADVRWYHKLLLPSYRNWKLERLKANLASNPIGWTEHPELKDRICPLSGSLMLFPVRDQCGHYFDYRSLRAYQLNPQVENPLACPIRHADEPEQENAPEQAKEPPHELAGAMFDIVLFLRIQRCAHELRQA